MCVCVCVCVCVSMCVCIQIIKLSSGVVLIRWQILQILKDEKSYFTDDCSTSPDKYFNKRQTF